MDGTLAANYVTDEVPYDPSRIGEPIVPMVERVRRWLRAGDEVIIFTARMHPSHGTDVELVEKAVRAFCVENFGRELEVTCMKCPHVDVFYDDKAVRVERDTGRIFGFSDDDPAAGADSIGAFFG